MAVFSYSCLVLSPKNWIMDDHQTLIMLKDAIKWLPATVFIDDLCFRNQFHNGLANHALQILKSLCSKKPTEANVIYIFDMRFCMMVWYHGNFQGLYFSLHEWNITLPNFCWYVVNEIHISFAAEVLAIIFMTFYTLTRLRPSRHLSIQSQEWKHCCNV